VGASIGACNLVDRKRVLEAGGFDEIYFFYFEDLEIALRLRAAGHRIVCEPAALVFHDRGAGTPGLSFRGTGSYPERRIALSMRHRLLTILIHYQLRTLLLLLPALIVYELASLVLAVSRGWGGAWCRAWLWQFRNAGLIRERRRRARRARVRSDRELLCGGALPLAPGLTRARLAGSAIAILSRVLDVYWRLVRRLLG
jgi:GT2 family glycosyltransferase